jgi:fructan beta-fructosidase
VLHGGSSEYMIGSFDGKRFVPEAARLNYAEGKNARGQDILYATQSFENMPDGRRVQMAWGRIDHPGMAFTQMILFPTEFRLKTTMQGIRLQARPIGEISALHGTAHHVDATSLALANRGLAAIPPGPLHIKMAFTLPHGHVLRLRYQGNTLVELSSNDLAAGGSPAGSPGGSSTGSLTGSPTGSPAGSPTDHWRY